MSSCVSVAVERAGRVVEGGRRSGRVVERGCICWVVWVLEPMEARRLRMVEVGSVEGGLAARLLLSSQLRGPYM